MKTPLRAGIVYACCFCVAACAARGISPFTSTAATLMRATSISAHDARGAITLGKSTKAEVIAVLGKTVVISFDSGFEVWVYRYTGDSAVTLSPAQRAEHADSGNGTRGNTEFVVLFAPSGIATKTRIRPAPPPV